MDKDKLIQAVLARLSKKSQICKETSAAKRREEPAVPKHQEKASSQAPRPKFKGIPQVSQAVIDSLSKFEGCWKKHVPVSQGGYLPDEEPTDLPEGIHLCEITDCRIPKDRTGKGPTLHVTFTARQGPYRDRTFTRFYNLANDKMQVWLKMDLRRLGIGPPDHLRDIPKAIGRFMESCDRLIKLQVKPSEETEFYYKGRFINGYILGFSKEKIREDDDYFLEEEQEIPEEDLPQDY